MKKRRRKLLLLAAGLLTIGGSALLWQEFLAEPTYEGKPLSHWVLRLEWEGGEPEDVSKEVTVAIRKMGAEAVPCLLRWIAYDTPAWRQSLNNFSNKHPFLKRLATDEARKTRQANGAMYALGILGPQARNAKGDLLRLFKRENGPIPPGTRPLVTRAAYALGSVAPEAFPVLVQGLSSKSTHRRASSALGLEKAGTNALPALPELLERVADPDSDVMECALIAADELIKGGRPAVPYLLKALQSQSLKTREWATNGLLRIAPDVLTNAPPATLK